MVYSFSHVLAYLRKFLKYCSGDLWTGTIVKPSNASFNLYFSGHLNFAAVLDYLIETAGLGT